MKHELPSLEALKVFESAARHLSFSLAAGELCITKSAVSYQVRKLERDIDVALFRRSVRQVFLTEPGQQLLHRVQRLFAELSATLAQIRPADNRHDVLIGATTYVALRWLSPRIAAFGESHPEVSILIQHSVNSEDFRIQDVDIAIRWCALASQEGGPRAGELPMPLFPVCSPRLLRRCQVGDASLSLEPADLARPPLNSIPLLCEDRALDLWLTWYGARTPPLENPRRVIADANVRTQAAIDGQGWMLADAMMQRELDDGALLAPFAHRLDGYGYAIQSASGRFLSRNALTLRDWLIEKR